MMAPGQWFVISSFILMMGNVGLNLVRGQISWTPIYIDTSNRLDMWTEKNTGCECPDGKSLTCACCVKPSGCLCSTNLNKCAQCGLEESCQRSCNVTISARSVATRSGLSWVQIKSLELEGPTSCFWRLYSAPGQRIEVQIHRIISIGSFDNSSQTCKDGFLQFADGDTSIPSTQAIQLCGQNSRFSPPVVMFGDQGMATLYLRIEGKSTRSQVLAYVSFSSADDPTVGDPSRGGRLRPHSVCDWTFDKCWQTDTCILSSPGYPGLFPPHRRCRYFLTANSTMDKILIRFQSLNIPPPPLCSSHHIAIWRKNVSNLVHLGPPWKTLCAMSDSTVLVEGGQALIEFRSGSTTSPNLYNGFRASVEFQHSAAAITAVPTTFSYSAKRTIPTTHWPLPTLLPTRNFPVAVVRSRNSSNTTTSSTIGGSGGVGNGGADSSQQRRMNNGGEKSQEEPLGYARANTDDPRFPKAQVVTCGHTFDGSSGVREEGFRLKIPKDLTSMGKKGGSSSSKNSRVQESLHNSKKLPETFHCRIEFLGKDNDVVQLALSNYKLRGSNCSSQIEVYDLVEEEQDRDKTTVDRLSNKLCGPTSTEVTRFTSTYNKMALSIVVSPSNIRQDSPTSEFLEGVFRFHDESIEGTVQPQQQHQRWSSCGEVVFSGLTSSPSGSLPAFGPSNSPLSRLSPFPLLCTYAFHPAWNQSILLTLVNSTTGHHHHHDTSSNTKHDTFPVMTEQHDKKQQQQENQKCRTVCSISGCICEVGDLSPLDQIDHFTIVSGKSTEVSCLCGSLDNVLPIVFESDQEIALIAHYASSSNKVLLQSSINISYQFTPNKSRYTNFTVLPPSGWKRWREIIPGQTIMPRGTNMYKIYDLTWQATIPIRTKLSIDLLSEENEQDCNAWNLTVWAEDDKLPNHSSYLLSSFCPAEGRRQVKVPETVRNAFIKLQGVSIRVPQFEVRWRFTQDASLYPEKMMSDTGNKPLSIIQQLVFNGMMSILMEVVLCKLLIFNYI